MLKRRESRGPSLAPLQDYMEAQRQFLKGNMEGSLRRLSGAVGSDSPLERLRGSLPQVFDGETPLSDMLLHLVLVETRKGGETK